MTLNTKIKRIKKLRVTVLAVGLSAVPPAALAQSTMTDGLVIKIDQAVGKITIKHGPLKQCEREAGMTMVYRADNPAMLKNISVGDKIKFVADRANGQFTVTRIEKAR
jgi:Cu(I)/Ag(I) efflux system periplasmic protein CusF